MRRIRKQSGGLFPDDWLALEGVRVSAITIQQILNDSGLDTKSERWLTPEQATFIEKLNPCFRERHVESFAPGELLVADTFFVGSLKGIGRIYLHTVVDSLCSYAFGLPRTSRQPEAAVAVLHNDVLPFCRNLDRPVGAVLTDNGREFCGTKRHSYLDLNGTVLDDFFRVAMRDTFYDRVETLQADLDTWLVHYKHRAAASRLPQQGQTPPPNRHLFRQPRRLSGHPIRKPSSRTAI